MANRRRALQPTDNVFRAEDGADLAKGPVVMELVAIKTDDSGGFLAAVLHRVEAEGGHGGGLGMAENAEDGALLVEVIVIEGIGRQHLVMVSH